MASAEADAVVDLRSKAIAAVVEGDVFVLEQLLRETDLDLNTVRTDNDYDAVDRSLLMLACQHKQLNVMKWLCEHLSVEMETENGRTALQWACVGVAVVIDLDVVRVLLESLGADVEHCNRSGESPLCWACWSVSLDVLRYLIEECDADVERIANNGVTAFGWACYCSTVTVIECLGERTDCDVSDGDGGGGGEEMSQYLRSVWQLNV